jgi:nicotinate-nucleotide pyrophosphorylase (carboxylating)
VPLLTKIEVECDTLEQAREAIDAGADMLLLDNMNLDQLREAVAMAAGRVPLEASGGVTLATVRDIAETGVDFISSGRITQSPPAVDIGLDVILES